MEHDIRRTVEEYYRAIDANDLDTVFALFADDTVYRRPGYAPLRGKAELVDFYRDTRIIADGRHQLESVVVEGGEAAVRGSFHGRSTQGEDLRIRFADFFRFSADLIVERNTYFDVAGV